MTAAQFALQVAAIGSGEIAAVAVPTLVVALIFIAPMAVASWWLRRRTRRMPFPKEELGGDLDAFPRGGPPLPGDTAEAIKLMAAEWEKEMKRRG